MRRGREVRGHSTGLPSRRRRWYVPLGQYPLAMVLAKASICTTARPVTHAGDWSDGQTAPALIARVLSAHPSQGHIASQFPIAPHCAVVRLHGFFFARRSPASRVNLAGWRVPQHSAEVLVIMSHPPIRTRSPAHLGALTSYTHFCRGRRAVPQWPVM